MGCIKSICAVYDAGVGSAAVLEQAVPLARENGARLTVLALLGEKRRSLRDKEEAHCRLRHVLPWIRQQGVEDVKTTVRVGAPYSEIMREVTFNEHDLVILSDGGGRGFADMLFGNAAACLIRNCPCPVWVLKPGVRTPCSRVLAAIGREPDGVSGEGLNGKILAAATAIARSHGAKLHVVHVWAPEGEDAERLKSELPNEMRQRLELRCEARCRSAVNALMDADAIDCLDHEIHLPRGLPHLTIVELAHRLRADVIVMGSDRQDGAFRFLGGSRAESVLGNVRCGVLTVKPDAFRPASVPYDPPARQTRSASVGGR